MTATASEDQPDWMLVGLSAAAIVTVSGLFALAIRHAGRAAVASSRVRKNPIGSVGRYEVRIKCEPTDKWGDWCSLLLLEQPPDGRPKITRFAPTGPYDLAYQAARAMAQAVARREHAPVRLIDWDGTCARIWRYNLLTGEVEDTPCERERGLGRWYKDAH